MRAKRFFVWVVVVLGASVTAVACVRSSLRLVAPHDVRVPAATLDEPLREEMNRLIGDGAPQSIEDTIAFALHEAGAHLDFGLGRATRLAFDKGIRRGNCVEYAHLFGTAFNLAARKRALAADAFVVHSGARVLGMRLPWSAWREHDWVVVIDRPSGHTWYVDPTLWDAWLGWRLDGNVVGEVRVPSRAE